MVKKQAVFAYKTVKGPLHKVPAMLKIFILLPLSTFCMSLSPFWLLAGIIVLIPLAFVCGFTLREQLCDLKPAVFYGAVMYALSVFSILIESYKEINLSSLQTDLQASLQEIFFPREDFLKIALSLAVVLQLSALLFRTTKQAQIRECLNTIERLIRAALFRLPLLGKYISLRPRFAQNITLFLCFVPEIFQTWAGFELAWKARSGRQGMAKIRTLCFVLISMSFEKAALKSKAIEARGGNE